MGALGRNRLKPLIPFGGACRLIDFSLDNAQSSGLADVLLLSQFEERQLMDDLRRTWWQPGFRVHFGPHDFAYRDGVPRDPVEFSGQAPERGTADALLRKAPFVFGPGVRDVLILHADHVYRFDYGPLLAQHRASGAALTLTYQRIERRYVKLFGMVEFGEYNRLTSFVEKPEHPTSDLVFAAFCVFDAKVLHAYLEELDGSGWQYDISRDVIPAMLAGGEHIEGYCVEGPWADIGTVERYHRAHMQSVRHDASALRVDEMPWTINPAVSRHMVPIAPGIRQSVVAQDSTVHGQVSFSVLFPQATVEEGAVVMNSVVLPGATITSGSRIEDAIVLEDGQVLAVPELTGSMAGERRA